MPVTTTTEAGRAVMLGTDPRIEENASAKLARKRAEAQKAAAALNTPEDAPLFPEPPVATPKAAPVTFTIHASVRGFPIDVAFSGSFDLLESAVKRLEQLGATPPPRPTFGGGKPQQKPLTVPLYRDDGTPCCPHHTNRNGQPTPIRWVASKDGRPGFWGCPSAAQQVAGETINSRGYCDLRFDAPAPAEVAT